MAKGSCNKQDCTIAETAKCLEGHEPPSTCPHYIVFADTNTLPSLEPSLQVASVAPLTSPPRRFHAGFELGTQDAAEIMCGHYTHLIGIVGCTNVGKTCFLSSLYLLASHGHLRPDYLFAGSLTLQGFEDRVRLLRKWADGILPDKLAEHTTLQNPRQPAFVHLALREPADSGRRLELLLTDLPGEWFSSLINHSETAARFSFLKRTDGIIFVVDGPLLAQPTNRHAELLKSKILLDRLSNSVGVSHDVPFVLLVSKCDLLLSTGNMPEIVQIRDDAVSFGFKPTVIWSAAFSSQSEKIKSGTGVKETIKTIVSQAGLPAARSWAGSSISGDRAFGRFQHL